MKKDLIVTIFFTLFYLCYGRDSNCSSAPFIQATSFLTILGYTPKCVAEALSKCSISCTSRNFHNCQGPHYHGEAIKDPLRDGKISSSNPNKKTMAPTSCAEFQKKDSGIETIFLPGLNRHAKVFCDQETRGGGWTVIQHRTGIPHEANFMRSWKDYSVGFGDPEKKFWRVLSHGSYWLGLDNISDISSSGNMSLLIALHDSFGQSIYAHYETFVVSSCRHGYRLRVGGFTGNTTDYFSHQNGERFRTYDRGSKDGCPEKEQGGWWHKDCRHVNLNGSYRSQLTAKMVWGETQYNRIVGSTMMVRPRGFGK